MVSTKLEFTTTFATYQADHLLGQGGSGRVYAAEGDDGEQYAIKVLDADNASRDKARRFKNEILFGTRHRSKNIVPILDHGLWVDNSKSRQFYVMPRYAGTLRSAIKAGIKAEQVLPLFAQVLDGVEAAHLLGVVHRDIKPENILIDATGTPLIADFGIARFASEQMATVVETKPTSRLANFVYAAPEQRVPDHPVDARADVFALGLVLNELFTGVVPHGTGYMSIAQNTPSFAFLDAIVAAMIAQRPEDRPSSINSVKNALIARQQECVQRQKLDSLKEKVVPAATVDDPIARNPIQVTGGDWDSSQLLFRLSQAPPNDWKQLVATSSGGVSFFMNYPPELIQFTGDTAYWRASEGTAQEQIAQFKQRVEHANRTYVRNLESRARQREEAERRKLQESIQAEERRQRVAKKLQF